MLTFKQFLEDIYDNLYKSKSHLKDPIKRELRDTERREKRALHKSGDSDEIRDKYIDRLQKIQLKRLTAMKDHPRLSKSEKHTPYDEKERIGLGQ